jgi:hypothetical protein
MNPVTPEFEQEVKTALAVPEPDREFLAALKDQIYARKPRRLVRSIFARPVWAGAIALLTLAIVVVLAIGPQRVIAAFQQLFGYFPGFGIVDIGQGEALAAAVETKQDSITLRVEECLATADGTLLVYSLSGAPQGEVPYVAHLQFPDGSDLYSNDYQTSGDPANLTGSTENLVLHTTAKYAPLPKGVRDLKVVLERYTTSHIKPSYTWVISLHLQRLTDELRARLFPPAYAPVGAQATYQGITLQVMQVAADPMENSTVLKIKQSLPAGWGPAISYQSAELQDDLGGVYPQKYLDVQMSDQGQRLETAVIPGSLPDAFYSTYYDTVSFQSVNPFARRLTLSLEEVGVRAAPSGGQNWINLELGANPKPGEVVPLDVTFQVAGQPLHIREAQIVEKSDPLLNQGAPFLALELLVDPLPGKSGMLFKELSLYGGDEPRPMSFIPNGIKLTDDQTKTGRVSVYIDYAEVMFTQPWTVTWDVPEK